MNKIKPLFFILIFLLFIVNINAAWLNELSMQFTQPDGTILDLYITGDEHHRWIHDADGYTIYQDLDTDYYCWAIVVNDDLTSSGYPVHLYSPQGLGFTPYQNISDEGYLRKRERMDSISRNIDLRAPSIGTLENIVIFIRFSDQAAFTQPFSSFNTDFNSSTPGVNSVYNYYQHASNNQMTLNSHFFPLQSGTTVVTYDDPNPRNYYTIAGAGNANTLNTRFHTMLRNAVLAIASQVPPTLVIDADNDGEVDNVVFLIKGGPALHNDDLLWPHKWYLYYAPATYIHGKRVYLYNVNLEMSNGYFTQGVSVYCHELAHSFGAPDLYRYSYSGITPIGQWCLMASTNVVPQSITAHLKQKYLNWITIPTITGSGTYSINTLSLTNENVAYRINSPNATNQYFVVEYRRNSGTGLNIDNNLPGSGVLVYRVRTGINSGNMNGPPDELYVYRPNGTLTANGQLNNAFFSSQSGRTAINDTTNPNSFIYSNTGGTSSMAGGLDISNITASGSEYISFYATIPNSPNPPQNLSVTSGYSSAHLNWEPPQAGSPGTPSSYRIYRGDTPNGTFTQVHQTPDAVTTTYIDLGLVNGFTYYYKATAVFTSPNGESGPSNLVSVTTEGEPPILNPPQNLQAEVDYQDVTLTWDAPNSRSESVGNAFSRSVSDADRMSAFPVVPDLFRNLLGYYIYRDDILLNVNPTPSQSFNDINVPVDSYTYSVTALYTEGESEPISIDVTTIAALPNPATNPTPPDGATNGSLIQRLSWTPSETGGTPIAYKIHFGTTNPPPLVENDWTTTTWRPSILEQRTQYFWQIVPFNVSGDALDCPIWSFTTISIPPYFVIGPLSHDFGSLAINQTSPPQMFSILNFGGSELIISQITISGQNEEEFILNVENLPWILTGVDIVDDFYVSFSPTTTGLKSADLIVFHNDEEQDNPYIVPISGLAVEPPFIDISPASFDFGELQVGQSSQPHTFIISNLGGSPLIISSIEKSGDNPSDFFIELDFTTFPWPIDSGDNIALKITFTPRSQGERNASIFIGHNAQNSPFEVLLSGGGFVSDYDIVIQKTELLGNFPNPFNPSTYINFNIAIEGLVTIDIFDIRGSKVITLIDAVYSPGNYQILWNSVDDYGRDVSSGIYFYRMKTDEYVAVKRMLLLK
ncbi:MAG: M6 family metalloprotease domain-containing protein [Candidatus Cloacimonetes bacterium]|nr:M6 family metalloprotease domain-containing protein [Candidatus Cloacimonadota bacterium]